MTKFGIFDCKFRESFTDYQWKILDRDEEVVCQGAIKNTQENPFDQIKTNPNIDQESLRFVIEEFTKLHNFTILNKNYEQILTMLQNISPTQADNKVTTLKVRESNKRIVYHVSSISNNDRIEVYLGFNVNKVTRIVMLTSACYVDQRSEYSSNEWYTQDSPNPKTGLFYIG